MYILDKMRKLIGYEKMIKQNSINKRIFDNKTMKYKSK